MRNLRTATALIGAATIAASQAPDAAQAEASAGSTSPSIVLSKNFAGHRWDGVDANRVNSATFKIHDWNCGAEDSGVESALFTYDYDDSFNGGASVVMTCLEGVQMWEPQFSDSEVGVTPVDEPVVAGDHVKLKTRRDDDVTTYTINNLTQGWSRSESVTGRTNGSVQVGDFRVGDLLPPPFGRDSVKNVKFDGLVLGQSDSQRVQLVDADGTTWLERTPAPRTDQRFRLFSLT